MADGMWRFVERTWRLAASPLYRNALLIMSSNALGSGLGFFFWLVVARLYATPDLGYAVALVQALAFLATLSSLGLGTAIIRFLPETAAKAPLLNTAATVVGLTALLLATAFVVGVPLWSPGLSFIQANPIYLAVSLVTAVAVALPAVYDQASYAMRRADILVWRTLVLAVAKIPLAFLFASISLTQGRLGVFMALAFAYVLASLVEIVVLFPRAVQGYRPRPQLAFEQVRPLLRFSLGNYAASSIGAAGGLLLPIAILDILGPAGATNVAFFYIAAVVAGLLNIIPGAVFTSFYAEASQAQAKRHRDERQAVLLSVALLVPGISVLWVFSEELLTWFGNPAYAAGSVAPLHILIFGSIPTFLNSILATRVLIRKRSAPLIVASAISTAVTLGLGLPLLQTIGIEGLAVAAVLGSAAATPYYYVVARKSFRDEATPPMEPSLQL
jgi:O-antigen/teichoic acid export membrane protein